MTYTVYTIEYRAPGFGIPIERVVCTTEDFGEAHRVALSQSLSARVVEQPERRA